MSHVLCMETAKWTTWILLYLSLKYKVKLVGKKLNLALVLLLNKNEFEHFYSCSVITRNSLEWINHWLYLGNHSCNRYIELSVTSVTSVILNLHQFLSNSYPNKFVLSKPTKVTFLFFMSNFNDPLAMKEKLSLSWLSIFARKQFL